MFVAIIITTQTVAMASSCLADTPDLPHLQRFTTMEGNSVNVIEMIGINYASFGTCLLNDVHGHKINNIENDHHLVMDKIRAILITWLKGRLLFILYHTVKGDCARELVLKILLPTLN